MHKDTIIVTGAAGFMGSWVANDLHIRGHKVIALDDLSGGFHDNLLPGIEFVFGSINNTDLLDDLFSEHKPRFVFHLAAYAAEGLSHFIRRFNYQNNLIGSVNIINQCIRHKVECLVFTSSIAVYGSQHPPFSEKFSIPSPIDPYGVSKLAVEMDLKAARETHKLNSVVFRPFNVYGVGQNFGDPYRNVIGIFMRCAMEGSMFPIFGDGEQTRGFSYASSVIPALTNCIKMPDTWNQTYNIGGRMVYTVRQVAETVAKVAGVELKLDFLPPRHEAVHAHADTDKAHKVFGHLCQELPLETGIGKMWAWASRMGPRTSQRFKHIEIDEGLPPSWKSLT